MGENIDTNKEKEVSNNSFKEHWERLSLDKKREFISESILSSKESIEQLGFSRQYLNQLVREGKIHQLNKVGVYLKEDIYKFKKERDILNKKQEHN